jgi:hypothetical protein
MPPQNTDNRTYGTSSESSRYEQLQRSLCGEVADASGENRLVGRGVSDAERSLDSDAVQLGERRSVAGERRSFTRCPKSECEREEPLAERIKAEIAKQVKELESDTGKKVKEFIDGMNSFARNSKLRLDAVDGILQTHCTRLNTHDDVIFRTDSSANREFDLKMHENGRRLDIYEKKMWRNFLTIASCSCFMSIFAVFVVSTHVIVEKHQLPQKTPQEQSIPEEQNLTSFFDFQEFQFDSDALRVVAHFGDLEASHCPAWFENSSFEYFYFQPLPQCGLDQFSQIPTTCLVGIQEHAFLETESRCPAELQSRFP